MENGSCFHRPRTRSQASLRKLSGSLGAIGSSGPQAITSAAPSLFSAASPSVRFPSWHKTPKLCIGARLQSCRKSRKINLGFTGCGKTPDLHFVFPLGQIFRRSWPVLPGFPFFVLRLEAVFSASRHTSALMGQRFNRNQSPHAHQVMGHDC